MGRNIFLSRYQRPREFEILFNFVIGYDIKHGVSLVIQYWKCNHTELFRKLFLLQRRCMNIKCSLWVNGLRLCKIIRRAPWLRKQAIVFSQNTVAEPIEINRKIAEVCDSDSSLFIILYFLSLRPWHFSVTKQATNRVVNQRQSDTRTPLGGPRPWLMLLKITSSGLKTPAWKSVHSLIFLIFEET